MCCVNTGDTFSFYIKATAASFVSALFNITKYPTVSIGNKPLQPFHKTATNIARLTLITIALR